jgi:hypothetical protein
MKLHFLQTSDPFNYYRMFEITSKLNRAYCAKYNINYTGYIGICTSWLAVHYASDSGDHTGRLGNMAPPLVAALRVASVSISIGSARVRLIAIFSASRHMGEGERQSVAASTCGRLSFRHGFDEGAG